MKIHIVQRGDTLWSISEKYGVSFEEVKKMNAHLANPEMIVPGMKIKIPESAGHKGKEKIVPKKEKEHAAPVKEKEKIYPEKERVHPFAHEKPTPYPPVMELEMEEIEEPIKPENWMTQPVPAPSPEEHGMMMPCPPMPCYFYPIPFPMPYPMPHMMPYMHEVEMEREEKIEMQDYSWPHMMPHCPYCHR
ncbi:hypothetical protein BTO30_05805 [Domibacillus antri]|uniref:LysM domain-containing protein n=1 Tax=Domibacillus antri TaxID=1714264 RepID=A0A1Q8Q812_9BACI|nr:SafA/ExsA family spore coat assembly protein [Domibacillus antri]OLN23473.1 hypothetical protein BTO30_05805 [Domibacillus antri]